MSIARFVEPMLLLPASALPEGANITYEVKFDGYRTIAIRSDRKVRLRSRNDKDFNRRYPALVNGLTELQDETVVDAEVVALDSAGRLAFNALQNESPGGGSIVDYFFDLMILAGRAVISEPLVKLRGLLSHEILPRLGEPIRELPVLEASLPDLISAVCAQGLEGLAAAQRSRSSFF